MTEMNPIFSQIFSKLPTKYMRNACIAGGAAVDLAKASDIDVFILNITRGKYVTALQNDLKAAIKGIKIETVNTEYTGPSLLVATIPGGGILPDIQIIASECWDIGSLLDNFDLSTHAVAWGPDGVRYVHPMTTSTREAPVIIMLTDPVRTLLRYRKLCLRYKIPVSAAAMNLLCQTPDKEPEAAEQTNTFEELIDV